MDSRNAVASILLGACGLLMACDGPLPDEVPLVTGDRLIFEQSVQPVIGPSCGTLDCHGEASRPLRLYSESGLRLSVELRGEPVSAEEIDANLRSIAAIEADSRAGIGLFLGKPLPESAGGMDHVGGDIWEGAQDPGHVCAEGWLRDMFFENERLACIEATPELP